MTMYRMWVSILVFCITVSEYTYSTTSICTREGRCCPDHCQTCEANAKCTECETGYWGPECEYSCEGCVDCSSDACNEECYQNSCFDKCPSGFFYRSNRCHQCPDHCETCINENECVECKGGFRGPVCQYYLCSNCAGDCSNNGCSGGCSAGYYQIGGKCIACSRNCVSCTNETQCEQCHSGFWGPTCQNNCELCPGDCIEEHKCICATDEYASQHNGKYVCAKCPIVCKSCKDNYHCETCQDNQFEDMCQIGCLGCETNCDINNGCSGMCLKGTFKSSLGNLNNRFHNVPAFCEICSDGCSACSSRVACDECVNGRWGKACQNACNTECPDKCDKETGSCPCNDDNCKTCYSTNRNMCFMCLVNFYADESHNCQECPKSCKEDTSCSGKDGTCLNGCNEGYSGRLCDVKCIDDCLECDQNNRSLCMACAFGYFGERCDQKCSSNCIETEKDAIVCDIHNGECLAGCKPAWWGNQCEHDCSFCKGTDCDREDGSCKHGCIEGYTGKFCSKEQSLQDEDDGSIVLGVAVGCGLLLTVAVAGISVYILLKKGRKNLTPQCNASDKSLSTMPIESTAKPMTYEDLSETRKVETEYDGLNKDVYYIYIDDTTSKQLTTSVDEYASVSENDSSETQICKSDKENDSERSLTSAHKNTVISSPNPNAIDETISQKKENSCKNHSRNTQHVDSGSEMCHDYLVLDECNDEHVQTQDNVYEHLESSSSHVYNVLKSVKEKNGGLKIAESSCLNRAAESTYHILEPTPKEQMYEPEVPGHEKTNDVSESTYHVSKSGETIDESESTYHILEPITNEPSCVPDEPRSGETGDESKSPYHILEPITIKTSCAPDIPNYEVTTAGTESTYHILEPISNEQNASMYGESTVDSESTYHILESITNENSNAPDTAEHNYNSVDS